MGTVFAKMLGEICQEQLDLFPSGSGYMDDAIHSGFQDASSAG